MIRFEWDPTKARRNQRKHGITFEQALNIFDDEYALFEQDRTDDQTGELRWKAIGLVGNLILLVVVHTVREEDEDEVIRLISARRADRKERNRYGQIRAQDIG